MSPPDFAARRALLVEQLRSAGALTSDGVAEAFVAVPRELFIPDVPPDEVYLDRAYVTRWEAALPASSSSQPAVMAAMLEQLDVQRGDRVLEIGAGTGYNAALLARLVAPGGRVTSVEIDPATASAAARHLAAAAVSGADVVTGDGLAGVPKDAPYDRIIVTASARELPRAWIDQLRPGGRLVVPLRLNAVQAIFALERDGDALSSVSTVSGGFMALRSHAIAPLAVELPDGSRADADVPLDDAMLASLMAHEGDARPAVLPVAVGPRESYPAFLVVALQGAPIYGVDRRAGDSPRDSVPASSLVLVTSTQSALRWSLVPGGSELAVLGSDEALDFVRAALVHWRLAGEPGAEELRLRVTPVRGAGALSALPRPIAGAYRFARGVHAYDLHYAR
jgi:protein-L-isoaspartate(D-aspartate) O-methyltransferase